MPMPMMPPMISKTPPGSGPLPGANPAEMLPAAAMAGNAINAGPASAPPTPDILASIKAKLAPAKRSGLPGVGFKKPRSSSGKKASSAIKHVRGKLKKKR